MSKFILLCINVFFVGLSVAEVPSYIQVCGRQNSKLDECVVNSIEALRPKLVTGIPELGVPPLEPLHLLGDLPLTNLPEFKAGATNVLIHNLSDFQIQNLHVDLPKMVIHALIFFKKVRVQGDYTVSTKIIVPIVASGDIDIDVEGLGSNVTMVYALRDTKKGKRMHFTSMSAKIQITDYQSRLVLREEADVTFNDAINAVINTNREEIIASITPSLEKVIATEILKTANKICKSFTYNELFPDRE